MRCPLIMVMVTVTVTATVTVTVRCIIWSRSSRPPPRMLPAFEVVAKYASGAQRRPNFSVSPLMACGNRANRRI